MCEGATELVLTPTLIEWGCDEDLWSETRNKQALLDLAEAGNEAKGRQRIEFLKAAIAKGSDGSAAPTSQRVPNHGPYRLLGPAPEGVDVASVEELLEKRSDHKAERDFESADAIQAQLSAIGVYLDDRKRTWEAARAPNGGFTLKGQPPEGVDVSAVEAILAKRRDAKKSKDFEAADELQAELLAMGVYVDDKKRTWSAARQAAQQRGFKLRGAAPEGVDVAVVESMLEKRIECKKQRDFDASDALQKELMEMGVYVNDKARTWEEATWSKVAREAGSGGSEAAVESAE